MGYSWVVLCFVALCVNFAFSLIPLDGEKVQPPLRYHQDPANGLGEEAVVRVEREAVKYSSPANCTVNETSADVTKIIETEDRVYSFFFKPLPGFRKLMFYMIVDNDFDISGPYEWKDKSLVVYESEMKQDMVGEDGWVPVKIEHYRHTVALAPDRLGLRVSVGANGSLIRSLVSRNRWTHDYEGFTAYVGGKAMIIIGCSPSNVTPIMPDTHSQQQVQHSASHVLLGIVEQEQEAVEYSSTNCTVSETSADVTKILETEDSVYSFFFKPLPGFRKLVFHMIVDNDFDISGPYEWKDKSLVVYESEMKQDMVGEDGWVPVKIEHYRHTVALAPDRLGLRVSVGANGSLVRSLVSRNRWTHDYEGFTAYIGGKALIIIGCSPSSVTPTMQDIYRHQQVQYSASHVPLGIVVGGCFLLLLMVVVIILVLRGPGCLHDQPPPLPKQLPKSMLLKGHGQVWMGPDHISLDNLGCFNEEQGHPKLSHPVKVSKDYPWKDRGEGKGAATGPRDIDGAQGCSTGSQRTSEHCYKNAVTLSLLEDKELAWKKDPELETPPEEHYIEMGGIVSRTSSLLK